MRHVYVFFIMLIILYTAIVPAFADETEWVDPQEKTLRLTETFSREGFLIEASDFYENSALITVYDSSGNFIISNITRINDYFVVNSLLNITVIDLKESKENIGAGHGVNVVVDQWVKINTRVVGRPVPVVSIIPYGKEIDNKNVISHSFLPGSEIGINFSVKNEGKAILKNFTFKINSTLPLFYNDRLSYELMDLKGGEEYDINNIRFKAPITDEKKPFIISAEARGNDFLGRPYSAVDSSYIEVRPAFEKIERIELTKFVTEKLYLGDIALVSITIKNNGSRTIDNVTLIETPPSGLLPLFTNLTWNFTLGAFEQKVISYMVKPEKPGTYYFIPGSSRVEYLGKEAYNPKLSRLIVNGPYVVLKKSASTENPLIGDNITVTVSGRNLGDSTAIVKLVDNVPSNYSLTGDNDSFRMISRTAVLHPGDSVSLASYKLNTTTTGSYIIPPAKATVLDQYLYQDERYTQNAVSDNLTIKVSEPVEQVKLVRIPKKTAGPIKIPDANETSAGAVSSEPEQSPGFKGSFLIIEILFVLLMKKLKSKEKL